MLPTKETTATEVWFHAADHGDRPVIHGAELDYDDVHTGVHYHADLLDAAYARTRALRERRLEAADDLAFLINAWDEAGNDVRESGLYVDYLAEWRRLNDEIKESRKATAALIAKRDQDAAMATYEVSA